MRSRSTQQGTSLLEVLAVIVLFGIMALSLAKSTISAMMMRGQTEIRALQLQIGSEALEELAGIDPINLGDANDSTTTVTRNDQTFTRQINVTVNPDNSRTIDVSVTSTNTRFGGTKTLSATYAMWGSL